MKKGLRQLISDGKTDEVIHNLLDYFEEHEITDLRDEVIMLSNANETLKKSKRLDIGTHEATKIQQNKINIALLEIIHKIPKDSKEALRKDPVSDNETRGNYQRWYYAFAGTFFIGILAFFSGPGINLIRTEKFSIILKLPEGEDFLQLQKDSVAIIIDGKPGQKLPIGQNLRTAFVSPPMKAQIEIQLNSKFYKPSSPGKPYYYTGNTITFEIEPKREWWQIKGYVIDDNSFVQNAKIHFGDEPPVLTDSTGGFEITLDNKKVRKYFHEKDECPYTVEARGYKPKKEQYIVPTRQIPTILLFKKGT